MHLKQIQTKLKKDYIRLNSPAGKKRILFAKMKKDEMIKKQNAKQKHKTEIYPSNNLPKLKQKSKRKYHVHNVDKLVIQRLFVLS